MTRMSIHSVVAPLLAASLLTDTCRLTVGPGTREDLVAATTPVVVYIAPASAVFTSPAPLVVSAVELIQDLTEIDDALGPVRSPTSWKHMSSTGVKT